MAGNHKKMVLSIGFIVVMLFSSCALASDGAKNVILQYGIKEERMIEELPCVIDTPGYYVIEENFTNIKTNCAINIIANNVVIDGKGHTIDGPFIKKGTKCIKINATNVTVKNLKITDWETGIQIIYSDNITISHNEINRVKFGISIYRTEHPKVINNTIKSFSISILIVGEPTMSSVYGQGLYEGNTLVRKGINKGTSMIFIDTSSCNIFRKNIITGGYSGIAVNVGFGNIIDNNTISKNRCGINLFLTSGNIISGNNIKFNKCGIYISGNGYNIIKYNNFILNRRNAKFDKDYHMYRNTWDHNYWYNWPLPIPKPIFGKVHIGSTVTLPGIEFDYHPAIKPWSWD